MDYNFLTLNTRDFEHLVQSLTQKILGNNSLVFGDGPDGARELTFEGKANFPNQIDNGDGYWLIQAKFKSKKFTETDDYTWVKNNFTSEMQKFESKKRKLKIPKYYIFFTNAILTPVNKVGGKDKIEELKESYKKLIPNIFFISYDELSRLLDNNRDVATSYSSFILSGDILKKMYDLLEYEEAKKNRTKNVFLTYLEKSFNGERYSKLIQGGDVTNQQVNIEKVFIDINVTDNESNSKIKFLKHLIEVGDKKSKMTSHDKYVLVGGAGSGKSTLSQFITQIYTAFFVVNNKTQNNNQNINNFIKEFEISAAPSCIRFPFKIVLKDFASWVKVQGEQNQSKSVLNYMKKRIELLGDGEVDHDTLREFLKKVSFLFIFDGLDEVPATSNREEILKEINEFLEIELKNQNSDSIILCTTRQQGYSKEFDQNSFQHLYVSELSDEDCEIYLKKLLENIEPSFDDRSNYIKTLNEAIKDSVTGRLMRTPLQATIMTILVKSGGKPSRNKYNLFKDYYDTIYKRELQKELQPFLKQYKRNIDDIHSLLGFELQVKSEGDENPSALFDTNEFEQLIRNYLKHTEEWREDEIDSFIGRIGNIVTERLVFIGEIQEQKIGFVIRSLQEYFAANFLINVSDDKIIKNIKSIANSSYWRNTYLFAVSGLHNNKQHTIDNIYAQCEMLNGNEENLNSKTMNKTMSFGSLLALDILSEGIFSDSPKNTNRFTTLLENFFTNITISDLNKFNYLSDEILSETIIGKFISDSLSSNQNFKFKYSSFKICFQLLKKQKFNNQIYHLLEKYWVEDFNIELIELMVKTNSTENSFFSDKLYHLIISENYFKARYILVNDTQDEFKIIDALLENYKTDNVFISRLIEILFLSLLGDHIHHGEISLFSLFNKLNNGKKFKSENYSWGMLGCDFSIKEVNILDGYNIKINSIKSNNINLDSFIDLFKNYNLSYLLQYIEFVKTPNLNNLIKFFISLKERNDSLVYNLLIENSRMWLFKRIRLEYMELTEIDDLITSLKKGNFGDIKDWIVFEKKLFKDLNYSQILFYADLYTMSSGTSTKILIDFHSSFKDQILTDENFRLEFIKLFRWAAHDGYKDFKTLPNDIIETLLIAINSVDIENCKKWRLFVFKQSFLAFLAKIDLKMIEKINNNILNLFGFEEIIENHKDSELLKPFALQKCIDYYNSKLSLEMQSDIDRIIVSLLVTMNEHALTQIATLNYKTKKIDFVSESIYSIILRLLTSNFDPDDIDLILEKFNSSHKVDELYYFISKLFFELKIHAPGSTEFFVKIHYLLKSREGLNIEALDCIEQYLKFFNENILTNVMEIQDNS